MELLHSVVRWLVLLTAVAALVGYLRARGLAGFDALTERLGSAYAGAIGVQVLTGVALWVIQGRWSADDVFYSFIHPAMMLAAAAVASVGVARARRTRNATVGLAATVVSLIIVALAIPTDSWPL